MRIDERDFSKVQEIVNWVKSARGRKSRQRFLSIHNNIITIGNELIAIDLHTIVNKYYQCIIGNKTIEFVYRTKLVVNYGLFYVRESCLLFVITTDIYM